MSETGDSSNGTECYACGEVIEDGDWVVPLKTYEARYRGNDFVLNEDNKLETVIHARCLQNTHSEDTGDSR